MEPERPLPEPPADLAGTPRILPRPEHPISRRDIAKDVLWLLQRLRSLGYQAFLVGGAVRDLYLGKAPKDYDVGTDARPSRLKKVFRNCRIIGRRFRIAHVYFPGGRIVEVATFRRNSSNIVRGEGGMILRDNEFGTPEEDAKRRDLTINGLFYDSATFSVIDYVGGVQDLQDGIIRTIAEPNESFAEDPVRMIRAVRHAARTGFTIEAETRSAIEKNAPLIVQANSSRLVEEIFRDLRGGTSVECFRLFLETGLLEHILPELAAQLYHYGAEHPLWNRLEALDRHTSAGEALSNPVLLSALLVTLLFPDPDHWTGPRDNPPNVWKFLTEGLRLIPRTIHISRRDSERVGQILIAYPKLERSLGRHKLTPSISHKVYAPEALEFFQLDLESRGFLPESEQIACVADWREQSAQYQAEHGYRTDEDGEEAEEGGAGTNGDEAPRRRRRRRRRRSRSRR